MSCLRNCDLLSWDGLIYVKLFSKPSTLTCTSLRQLLRATGCHNAPWHYFCAFSTASVFYLHYLALAQVILSKHHNNITALSTLASPWILGHAWRKRGEGIPSPERLQGSQPTEQPFPVSLTLSPVIDWSHYIGGESPYLANPGVNVAAAWQIAALHPRNLLLMSSPAPDPHYKLLQNACMIQVSLISKFKSSASIKGAKSIHNIPYKQNNTKSIFDDEVLFIPVL